MEASSGAGNGGGGTGGGAGTSGGSGSAAAMSVRASSGAADEALAPGVPLMQSKAWQHADLLREFLAPDFDETKYIASQLTQRSSALLSDLTTLLHEINAEISTQVVSRHHTLLSQANHLSTLHNLLSVSLGRLRSLYQSVQRVQHMISVPYENIVEWTLMLSNIHMATDYLRQTHRFMSLLERMRQHHTTVQQLLSSTSGASPTTAAASGTPANPPSSTNAAQGLRELIKLAQSVAEIRAVLNETDLTGVDYVDEHVPLVYAAGDTVRSQGARLLARAMEMLNQSDIGTALQVFLCLGANSLAEAVRTASRKSLDHTVQVVRRTFDASTMGEKMSSGAAAAAAAAAVAASGSASSSSSTAGANSASTYRLLLWERVDQLLETVFTQVVQMSTLERVVAKKRDMSSQRLFCDVLAEHHAATTAQSAAESSDGKTGGAATTTSGLRRKDSAASRVDAEQATYVPILQAFWRDLCSALTREIASVANGSAFVKNVFLNEYPRLALAFDGLFARVHAHCSTSAAAGASRTLAVAAAAMTASSSGSAHGISNMTTMTTSAAASTNAPPVAASAARLDDSSRITLMNALEPFKTAFLARTMSRLLEPVNLMFPATSPPHLPTRSDIKTLLTQVHESLRPLSDAPADLQAQMVNGASKTLFLLVSHLSRLSARDADLDADLRHAIDAMPQAALSSSSADSVGLPHHAPHTHNNKRTPYQPSAAQKANAELYHLTWQIHRSVSAEGMRRAYPSLAARAEQKLINAWNELRELQLSTLRAVCRSAENALDACVIGLYHEDEQEEREENADKVQAADDSSALLIRMQHVISAFMRHCMALYVGAASETDRGAQVESVLERVQAHVLYTVVQCASLRTRVSDSTTVRLVSDLAQLGSVLDRLSVVPTFANGAHGVSGDSISRPDEGVALRRDARLRMLRECKELLFVEEDRLPAFARETILPSSVIYHFVLSSHLRAIAATTTASSTAKISPMSFFALLSLNLDAYLDRIWSTLAESASAAGVPSERLLIGPEPSSLRLATRDLFLQLCDEIASSSATGAGSAAPPSQTTKANNPPTRPTAFPHRHASAALRHLIARVYAWF